MVKILALCPNFNDATSFYRGAWPLSKIARKGFDIFFQKSGKDQSLGWAELSMFDVLFIQRPYTDWNLELMEVAKECGLKVWIDYDDDLFNLEVHNPAFKTYSNPKVKETISKILNLADVVTASTAQLKTILEFANKNIHVIRNATDFDLLANIQIKETQKLDRLIFWRGSKTHDNDLFEYAGSLGRISKKYEDVKFIFLGNPWMGLINYISQKQFIVLPPITLPKYFSFIKTLRPTISVVPLADTIFNRSKSNIGWQEATIAGSACMVPKWPEWDVHGAVTYTGPNEFFEQLDHLLGSPKLCETRADQSYVTMERDFNLKNAIDSRIEVLKKLCSM